MAWSCSSRSTTGAQLGELAPQPREEPGVLVAVVRPEHGADRPAAHHEVIGQGCRENRRVQTLACVVEHLPDAVVQPPQLRAQGDDSASRHPTVVPDAPPSPTGTRPR